VPYYTTNSDKSLASVVLSERHTLPRSPNAIQQPNKMEHLPPNNKMNKAMKLIGFTSTAKLKTNTTHRSSGWGLFCQTTAATCGAAHQGLRGQAKLHSFHTGEP